MNYLHLIQHFWRLDMEHHFSAIDTRLYFFLVQFCNRLGWKQDFGHSDRHLSFEIGASVNTVREAKQRLAERGLIKFHTPEVKSKSLQGQTRYTIMPPTVLKFDTVANTVPDTEGHTVPNTDTDTEGGNNTKHKSKPNCKQKERNSLSADAEKELFSFYIKEVDKSSYNEVARFIVDEKPQFSEPYVDLWNLWAEENIRSKVKTITERREKLLSARLKEKNFNLPKILLAAEKSAFVMEKDFLSFDWLVATEDNYIRILEKAFGDNSDTHYPGYDNDVDWFNSRQYKMQHEIFQKGMVD